MRQARKSSVAQPTVGSSQRGELWDEGALGEALCNDYRRDSDAGSIPREKEVR